MIPGLSFRPVTDGDAGFLTALYASTREKELAAAPWTEEEKREFLHQQFDAQHRFYRQQFPEAQFDIILKEGTPIGRLYVHRTPEEIRVIDIALLPAQRGRGLGRKLMQSLLDEAALSRRPVRIHVEIFNPALRLYQRLGFRVLEDKGVYLFMEWKPSQEAV